jgi:hypothetical protein
VDRCVPGLRHVAVIGHERSSETSVIFKVDVSLDDGSSTFLRNVGTFTAHKATWRQTQEKRSYLRLVNHKISDIGTALLGVQSHVVSGGTY